MRYPPGLLAAVLALASAAAPAQQQPRTILSRIEPGLAEAVKWKWSVESAGLPAPPASGIAMPSSSAATPEALQPGADGTYTVKKGDSLYKIARRHALTVEQLKAANNLTSDLIRVGDVLRIPGPEELAALPVPPPREARGAAPANPGAPPAPTFFDPEVLRLQVYLDRLNFSPGPIDGLTGLRFQKLMFTYLSAHELTAEDLAEKARAELTDVFTTYTLRPQDFQFIRIPASTARSSKNETAEERDRRIYRELTSQPELLYRSAWEFVAERFHCDETFLRKLNPTLKKQPEAGTVFRVPHVIPFEIERAFEGPLRPEPDSNRPVKAIIADLALLEIYQDEKLIAAFPVSVARPGLRGRGEWVILDTLPRPRLLTRREPRVERTFEEEEQTVRPAALAREEILGPGPRNPAGLLWIHLAKAEEGTPLPFGLHGTSVPGGMFTTESLGGFRLTNWDIFRAARLLPEGTPLRWRATLARRQEPVRRPTRSQRPAAIPIPAAPAAQPDLSAQPGERAEPAQAVEPAAPSPLPEDAQP